MKRTAGAGVVISAVLLAGGGVGAAFVVGAAAGAGAAGYAYVKRIKATDRLRLDRTWAALARCDERISIPITRHPRRAHRTPTARNASDKKIEN